MFVQVPQNIIFASQNMNEITVNNTIYKLICAFRERDDTSRDSQGNKFPQPKPHMQPWTSKKYFLKRLTAIQTFLDRKVAPDSQTQKCVPCLLCDEKCIGTKRYNLGPYIWDSSLLHYVSKHNIKPPEQFIDRIFIYNMSTKKPLKLFGRVVKDISSVFLKINRNQLHVLDALMRHGGYTKKYIDRKNKSVYRYSEHAGFLDTHNYRVDKIIVAANTQRVDRQDEQIYLPGDMPDAYKYNFIFHTHPPEKGGPGSRAPYGVLYEFPSSSDLLHFIEHHNSGSCIGSIVVTPEGLYNIHKYNFNTKKIKINEDEFYDEIRKTIRETQHKAIDKYTTEFTSYDFYSKISQDTSFIDTINTTLMRYDLIIDYYPRVKDAKGSWIIDTVYLPLLSKS